MDGWMDRWYLTASWNCRGVHYDPANQISAQSPTIRCHRVSGWKAQVKLVAASNTIIWSTLSPKRQCYAGGIIMTEAFDHISLKLQTSEEPINDGHLDIV